MSISGSLHTKKKKKMSTQVITWTNWLVIMYRKS
uniref:Uncharacterized protein n=1 Tax=Anguilla anguilla TaxID=7936 RepID=A0A0E9V5K8_ANGAN